MIAARLRERVSRCGAHALLRALMVPALLTAMSGCGAPTEEGLQPEPDAAMPACQVQGGDTQLRISEFLADNALTNTDEDGVAYDWIELYNPSSSAADLCGFQLRVAGGEASIAATFQESFVVAPGAYAVVWLVGDRSSTSPDALPLKIPASGASLSLENSSGGLVDAVTYGAQVADVSAQRDMASGVWSLTWKPTPGAANGDAGIAGLFIGTDDTNAPSADGITDLLLGYDEMPEIALRIDPADVQSLRDDPRSYVRGYVTVLGREYGPVGIRLKGQNSFQPIDEKPSFRINVDEFVDHAKLLGLDDLTLNNMDDDFSMMHERLAYMIAREFGPASRANHALVELNGEFYGLYANVETVKHHMLKHWFEDDSGSLFEATDVDFQNSYISLFEHESGPDDRSSLQGLADALAMPDPEEALAAATEFVDLDVFLRFWAMSAAIGQFDAFPYSDPGDDYFVYVEPTTNKLHFIPWGMDETFYSGSYDVTLVKSALAKTCLQVASCSSAMSQAVWDAWTHLEAIDIAAERTRIAEQIAPYVTMDTNKPYSNTDVSEFQTQLRYFIEGRRANLETMLPPDTQN